MGTLSDALAAEEKASAASVAASQVVTDLEAEPTTGGGLVDYTPQVITNADGSVVITLTPTTASAVVSERDPIPAATGIGSGISPVPPVSEGGNPGLSPTGTTEVVVDEPGPTGQ